MGSKSGAAVGAGAGFILGGPVGAQIGAGIGFSKGGGNQPSPEQQAALADRNRLKGMITPDNLQYLTPEEQKKYQDALNLGQGQISPKDEANYYKSHADALEALIAAKKERSNLVQQQIKLLQDTGGGKQTKNPDYLLQNAVSAPESILTAGQKAQEASKQGSILG